MSFSAVTYPVEALVSCKTKNSKTNRVETTWNRVACHVIVFDGKKAARNRIGWINRNWFWDPLTDRTFIVDPDKALYKLKPQRQALLQETPLPEAVIDSILLPLLEDHPQVGFGYLSIVRDSIVEIPGPPTTK